VHLQLGATNKALQAYQKELELCEALAQADPNNADAKRDLAFSHQRLGDVHLRRGATDEALQSYQKSLELREALAQADPNNADAKSNLAFSHQRLGDVHLRLGATDKALQAYEKDLELSEALANADPNNALGKSNLAFSYSRLGDVRLRRGATDKALQAFQKGLELSEALAQADPNNADAKRGLANSYSKLGDVHLRRGATDKALQAFQKELDLSEALAQADPNNAEAKRDLAFSYENMARVKRFFYNLAQVTEQGGDLILARPYYEKMLAVDRQLSERMPQSADARREVASDCEMLSQFCFRVQDWTDAISYARQAIDNAREARRLAGASLLSRLLFRWDFSITLQTLGRAQLGAGQLKEARQTYEEAVKAGPKSPTVHNELAWLLATSWDDSVRDGKKAAELATTACELTQWEEPWYLDTLAAAYAEAGKFPDAVKWQKKALEHPERFPAALIEQVKDRLKLYEAGKPYHEAKPESGPGPKDRPPSR
jgi:tetratricopeptide (TPR) repeat protein